MNRKDGALLGAALGALPATAFALWATATNPWFMDQLSSYLVVAVLPGALLGAALGALLQRGRGGAVLLAAESLALLAAAFWPRPGPVHPKVLVLGMDGATWDLIDKIELPALSALRERGASATLEAEEPLFSPLVWTTLATGERPDAHGIHGFHTRSDQTRAARFWEVAADAGMTVGIYKWLVTWPPRVLGEHGFIVPAWLAPDPSTWPESLSFVKELELSRRLKRKRIAETRPSWRLALAGVPQGLRWSTLLMAARWSVHERLSHPGEAERAWRLQLLRVWLDRDVFVAQLHRERPDVATFTTYATDALGHTHWSLMERCDAREACPPWGYALLDAYRQGDAILAELVQQVGPDTTIFVLSDHGFRAMDERDAGRFFVPLTEHLRARIQDQVGPVYAARMGHKVVITLLADDAEAERAALDTWLQALTQRSTGQPFYRWEPVEGTERAIGLTLRDENIDATRIASDTVGGDPLAEYARLTHAYSGEHDPDGILVIAGPSVSPGTRLGRVNQVDIAPTILATLGLPAGQDQPGRALFGEPLPRVPTHDPLAHVHHSEGGEVQINEDQLKALGYIE